MTDLNNLLRPDMKSVSWLHANFKAETIYVDNTFQRRSAWAERNKARLIETILNGYPMPEIYLWSGKADPQTGEIRFSVVDGQQRLTAIREYISEAFALRSSYLDPKNRIRGYAGKNFSELKDEFKQQIWDYQINTRIVPNTITRSQILAMFLRLNETDTSLNPQELRHAEFNGKFAKAAEQVAEFEFWKEWKFFTPRAIRRMGDIQFISALLLYLRQGLDADLTQAALNEAYDLYNDKYPEEKEDIKTFESILGICEKLFTKGPTLARFFKNQVHFYPLFVTLYSARVRKTQINVTSTARKMASFIDEYQRDKNREIKRYRLAATEGTQKRTNREIRIKGLTAWLDL
jgi:uncharacterized protein with ParB-like and HNH nuclease domain